MKILSKYKDYYDYLKGIYGEDNKLILDRREGEIVLPSTSFEKQIWRLYICGRILEFIDVKSKFYFGEDIAPYSEPLSRWSSNEHVKYIIKEHATRDWGRDKIYYPELSYDVHNVYKFPKIEAPIFLFRVDGQDIKIEHKFPRLTDLNINKVIPPHDVWLMLSQWLAEDLTSKEPIVPIGDDKIRIQSHGFDLKNSFRNTKNRMS